MNDTFYVGPKSSFTNKEIQAIQAAVPGIEIFTTKLAIVSTNYYDPFTTFHVFVETEEEGIEWIRERKKEGYSVNFEIVRSYMIRRYAEKSNG